MQGEPIIILASARRESDTKKFVEKVFTDSAYRIIDLLDFTVLPYDYGHQYSAEDDFFKIIDEIIMHDVIVFATPVYWYAMSGLMKIFFDRLSDIVTIKKPLGRQLKDKSTFLLAVGTEKELPAGFEKPFQLTSVYLKMYYQGHIYYSTKHQEPEQLIGNLIESFIDKVKKQSGWPEVS